MVTTVETSTRKGNDDDNDKQATGKTIITEQCQARSDVENVGAVPTVPPRQAGKG